MTTAQTVLAGLITSVPEQRFTSNNTAVTVFLLQVAQPARRAGQPDDFFTVKVTCWRQLAELATQLNQGQAVLVQGKLMMQTVTSPDGQNRKQFEVEAASIQQLSSLPTPLVQTGAPMSGGGGQAAPAMQQQAPMPQQPVQQAMPNSAAGMTPPAQPSMQAQQAAAPAQPVAAGSGLSDLTSEDFLMTDEEIPF